MRLRDLLLGLTPLADMAHVAFDLDGTLIDSGADLAAAVNHVRDGRGLAPIDVATVSSYVGEGAGVLLQRALGASVDGGLRDALAQFLEYYHAHCLTETRVYPGMETALNALRSDGRSLSVVTNKPFALAERILVGLELDRMFVALIGGDSLVTRKPNPEGLWRVAVHAGVPITRTVMVGDSPIDFDAATAAGSAFCGVAWGFAPERLRQRNPIHLARDTRHLAELFGASQRDDRRLDSRWRRR